MINPMVYGHVVMQDSVAALPSVYSYPQLGGISRKSKKLKVLAVVLIFLFLTLGIGNPLSWFTAKPKREISAAELHRGPDQIHLSLGDDPTHLTVMWSTSEHGESKVMYGSSRGDLSQIGRAKSEKLMFVDRFTNYLPYFHRASLRGLIGGRTYYYQVQTASTKSEIFSFRASNASTHAAERPATKMILLGGTSVDSVLLSEVNEYIVETRANGDYDALFQIGDLGGTLSESGDLYMRDLQRVSTRYPFLTVPGDHESDAEFLHYRYRFSMPGVAWPMPLDRLWYSFDLGYAHYIAYSTEIYYHHEVHIKRQLQWLLDDLIKANAKRDEYPWIIVIGHRPLYTSISPVHSAFSWLSVVRNVHQKLEDLFNWQGVDLIISSHEQMYERSWPVYKGHAVGKNYDNPKAPININIGSRWESARTFLNGFQANDWSAFQRLPDAMSRSENFAVLETTNHTHLKWKLIRSKSGVVVDNFAIRQAKHGKFRSDGSMKFGRDILTSRQMFLPVFYNVGYRISPWKLFCVVMVVFAVLYVTCKRCGANGDNIPSNKKAYKARDIHHVVHY
ncbi:acid phosphatase type 7-like [Tubulanus polymorphus]|uniref:acid phosphatase type 7-like n=1 Tax=Tubulanus polymorphus TaxID=672921 RepID=UPI003DA5F64B